MRFDALFLINLLCLIAIASANGLRNNADEAMKDIFDKGSYPENVNVKESDPTDKTLVSIYGIITIVGLVSNGFVFFVVFGRNEISKTATAMYVVQLAIADSIFLLSLPIFAMQIVARSWAFGSATCTICKTIKFLNYYAGIFFLTAMSVDRYIAVAYSGNASQLRNNRRTRLVCAIVWMVSVIMALPIAVFAKTEKVYGDVYCNLQFPGFQTLNGSDDDILIEYFSYSGDGEYVKPNEFFNDQSETLSNESVLSKVTQNHYFEDSGNINYEGEMSDEEACQCCHDNQSTSYQSWLILHFLIAFLIPFLVITICYVLILWRLRTSEERTSKTKGRHSARLRKRVTRTVAALVICFAVCWLPHQIFQLLKIHVISLTLVCLTTKIKSGYGSVSGVDLSVSTCYRVEHFLVALGFSNSAINPLLYTFLGPNFKERFCESVRHTKRRLRRGSLASLTGHVTRSHSDHGNTSITKKISNMVGRRRSSQQETREDDSHPDRYSKRYQLGKKFKLGVPLADLHDIRPQKSRWSVDYHQNERTECSSRSQCLLTESTRVMLDRDTRHDDSTDGSLK